MKGHPLAWSADELAWIEAHAATPRAEAHAAFVAAFGRPDVTRGAYSQLCKRKGWLTGRTGRFEPGKAPLYHGGGHHPNSVRTQFKPGRIPHTERRKGGSK